MTEGEPNEDETVVVGVPRVKRVPGQHGRAPHQLAMLSPCHPESCPAMPCHDTHSSTQTGQPMWPGLISCHSRWSRAQGHCGLLPDSTGPCRAPQTLAAHGKCVSCGSECTCTFMSICPTEGVLWAFCVL